jgi:hypothetical protein
MRMPPGATGVGVREDYELRDGASPSALERCAISAAMGSNLVGSLGRLCRAEPGDLYAAHAHGWARLTDVRQVAEMSAFP